MKKTKIALEVIFTIGVIGLLFLVKVPYLSIVLSGGLIIVYSALNQGLGKELGFIRPSKIIQTLAISILLACFLVTCSLFVFLPIIEGITGEAQSLGPFEQLRGDSNLLITSIAIGWFIGGIMEEIIFRGFLLSRITRLLPGKFGVIAGIIITSVIFGYLHQYQGITGQLLTGLLGSILAVIYILNDNKIWLNILIHGFLNTLIMVLLYGGYV